MSKNDFHRCEGCREYYSYVYPWGNEASAIAIVGDQPAPDHTDIAECAFAMDVDGAPRSKSVLVAVFAELGRRFDDYYWTNSYKCSENLTVDQQRDCEDLLREELQDFEHIIALGNNAARRVSTWDFDMTGIWHPAYVLRNPADFDRYIEQWEDALQSEHKTLDRF